MQVSLVITLLGDDRPGLVEAVSAVVAEHGGNWLESRMARLSGKFAGVLRVTVSKDTADDLDAAIRRLAGPDLSLTVEVTDLASEASAPAAWQLELVGHDRPGIIRDVAHALAQRGVNVVELHTATTSAPMTGEPLFSATARLAMPDQTQPDELRAALDTIAGELGLDLYLDESSD